MNVSTSLGSHVFAAHLPNTMYDDMAMIWTLYQINDAGLNNPNT